MELPSREEAAAEGLSPQIRQLALQGAAAFAVLSLAWPYYGLRALTLPWPATAIAIGAIALLLSRLTRQPWWWSVIHAGFAPLAIGLGLVLIHLVSIPVTNTSVNPARSTGPALFVGGWAIQQLWLFWVAPLIGGVIGGVVYRWLSDEPDGIVAGNK